jgi:hypothetical protein
MTEDEIIDMLKKLGWEKSMINMMMEFAELIKDIEREECAKLCDEYQYMDGERLSIKIRARGHTAIKKTLAQPEQQIAINSEIVGYVAPQRTWVGLTDEDLKLICDEWQIYNGAWMNVFVGDIEAKLKERNT